MWLATQQVNLQQEEKSSTWLVLHVHVFDQASGSLFVEAPGQMPVTSVDAAQQALNAPA